MRKAFIQLHVSVFLAGFTGVLGKLITLNEGLLVWYRLLLTCIALWAMHFFFTKAERVTRNDLRRIFVIGSIAALHWVTFYGSIKYSNVSVALVCFSAIGFFTAVAEPLISKTRVNKAELLLGLMTIVGIGIIFHFDPKYKTGIIVGIVSAMLASIFPVMNRTVLKKYRAETVTLYELTGGFLFISVCLPLYLYFFPASHILPVLSDWLWLLVLSLLCTVLAFNLSMKALVKVSAFTMNLTFNLEPIYGILLAFLIYKENKNLSAEFYIGMAIILVSVILQTLLVYREKKRTSREHLASSNP